MKNFENKSIIKSMEIFKNIKRAFTIVEFLIVMAIISILSSILLPLLSKARDRARKAVCMNNLRQIYISLSMYLNDYDEYFPCADDPVSLNPYYWLWMGRGWRKILMPYIKKNINEKDPSILYCPSDRTAPKKWESTSYGYSMSFYHSSEQINMMNDKSYTYDINKIMPSIGQKLSKVRYPDKKVIIAEWLDNHRKGENGWWSWEGARNYLFVDGHVEFLAAKKILPANDNFPDINLTKDGILGKDIE
jgi:prepilin-type N-terminal cleavage/methylation domain-containing protein/prepilin-type processing-associated H-X9-DG protein